MLGNLSIEEIEYRLNISLTDEDKNILKESHQDKAEKIQKGKWHCFDLPFMIVCGDKDTAYKFNMMFTKYDLRNVKQACQLTWEKVKE